MEKGKFHEVPKKSYSFEEAAQKYNDTILLNKKDVRVQKRLLSYWKGRFNGYDLNNISVSLLNQERDYLLEGETHFKRQRAPATINRYFAILSHIFSLSFKWGWINENPFLRISKMKEPRGRVRFLSDDERDRLLSVCQASKNKMLYPIVVLCLSTGARKMEIVGLNWKHVDLVRRIIILEDTKNGERRALPISSFALEVLTEYAKDSDKTGLVFPSAHNASKPIEIRKPWLTILQKANIEDFHFHDLRHSAASYLAMNGASLAEIAEVLGHKTLSMVKRYAHLSEAHTAKVVESMNSKIFAKIHQKS